MKDQKTHWRTFFPSDYLGGADLESVDQVLTLTVGAIEKKTVSAKKKDAPDEVLLIAKWVEDYKPMIVNVNNSKVLVAFSGSHYVEDWIGVKVDVYFNPDVTYMGETTGGLRFKHTPPKVELNPEAIEYAVRQLRATQTQKDLDFCFDGLSKDLRMEKAIKDAARAHADALNK